MNYLQTQKSSSGKSVNFVIGYNVVKFNFLCVGRKAMHITYKKLWKLLIDRDMSKQQLKEQAGISSASIAKLGKGENITTDVLLKICEALDCRIEDILETISESGKDQEV